MKHAKWIVAVGLVVLSGMAAAQLNSGSKIVAQVPFEFVVGILDGAPFKLCDLGAVLTPELKREQNAQAN